MRVPRYDEPQVGIPSVPSVRVQGNTSPQAFGAGIGEALQRAGEKLAYVAVKQQEEADRSTFALLSAKANAFAEEIYANEQGNPDYEGMNERFKEAWKGYKEKEIEALPERLREKASQMFDVSGMSYGGKFQGLFIQKQNDHIKRNLDDTVALYIKNQDIAGIVTAVEGSTVLSEEDKGRVIRKATHDIEYTQAQALINSDPYGKHDLSRFESLDEEDKMKLDDFQMGEQGKIERERRKVAKETKNALMAGYYKSNGTALWSNKDLDFLLQNNRIDDDTYADLSAFAMNVREDREREYKAEVRLAQTTALALMTDEEKEIYKLARMGTTKSMNQSALEEIGKLLVSGELNENILMDYKVNGKITKTQQAQYKNLLDERNKITTATYAKSITDNREVIKKMLNPMQAAGYVSMDDMNKALVTYDNIVAKREVKPEELDDLARKIITTIPVKKPKSGIFGFGADEGYSEDIMDRYNMIKELGSKEPISPAVEALFAPKGGTAKQSGEQKATGVPALEKKAIPQKGTPEYIEWIRDNL